jgi:hypothetical protein
LKTLWISLTFCLLVTSFAFAQSQQSSQGSSLSNSSSQTLSLPRKRTRSVKKIYRPNPPRLPTENPWILNLLSFVDMYQKSSLNRQWQEINFGYNFTEVTSLCLDWGYNGLLQPQSATDAEIWDPELLLKFKIPLNSKWSPSRWYAVTGTSLVIPASYDSVNNGMLAGFSANLGFEFEQGPWSVVNKNSAYVFAYQFQPTTLPNTAGSDNSDNLTPVTIQTPSSGADLNYVATQQVLRVVYAFNPQLSMKLDGWYYMFFNGGPQPTETFQVISTIGYYLTPHFRLFTGFSTSSEIDKAARPALFTTDSTGFRVGFFLKW